jgi:hypothetical protein
VIFGQQLLTKLADVPTPPDRLPGNSAENISCNCTAMNSQDDASQANVPKGTSDTESRWPAKAYSNYAQEFSK